MILTHGANSLTRGDFVEIGGRRYPVVKIGSQIWMAENLDYKWTGLDIGPSGTPSAQAAWYYNNDESTYGASGYKCGLLYNWYAAKYLDDNKATLLPDGWHVPTKDEWDTMISTVGTNPGTKLKALDNSITAGFPSGWNGTDEYELSIIPGGAYYGNFVSGSSFAGYRTATRYSESITDAYIRDFTASGTSSGSGYDNDRYGYSLRLIKDAT